MGDKGALPPPLTENLQMMRFDPCEEDLNVNIVLQSGIMMEMIMEYSLKIVFGFTKL